jgi:hypothetical protein
VWCGVIFILFIWEGGLDIEQSVEREKKRKEKETPPPATHTVPSTI